MKNAKRILAFVFVLLFLIACSFSSSDSQSQPSSEVESNETAEQAPQESTQTVTEETPITVVNENANSLFRFEIYEYKEDLIKDGWKVYHAKFRIVANTIVSESYILDLKTVEMNSNVTENQPHILTAEGYTYGNTLDTTFNVNLGVPRISTRLDLFLNIPIIGNRSVNDGSIISYDVNFTIPEKLTPQKLVIPAQGYSIDLPPLGTEGISEIPIPTEHIVDFPANVAVDPNINIKVSNFAEDDTYITIDYEIINNDITKNEYGFSYAALVDSYGFVSRQIIVDLFNSYTECPGKFLLYENVSVGPGQTKTGSLCFKKNTEYQSSFYFLYFSYDGYSGPDNKAILIRP